MLDIRPSTVDFRLFLLSSSLYFAVLFRTSNIENPMSSTVSPPASGVSNFRGVTGGVYKARERIHRSMLTCDY